MNLSELPFWTEADDAELDVLVAELVRGHFQHRERCESCAIHGSCEGMREAIGVVVDWRDGRILQSKAAYLRVREEVAA